MVAKKTGKKNNKKKNIFKGGSAPEEVKGIDSIQFQGDLEPDKLKTLANGNDIAANSDKIFVNKKPLASGDCTPDKICIYLCCFQ